MTTPVIRCIKNQTDSEIHLLVKGKFSEVFYHNPYISKIWTIEKSPNEIKDLLKNESFDLILDLQFNFRSLLLSWQLGKKVIRFNKLNIEKWLMTKFKLDHLPEKHLVDRYFDALKIMKVNNDGKGLDFFIDKNDIAVFEELNCPERYVVGVLGATYFTKQIPQSKWEEIIEAIQSPMILLGGITEKESGMQLSEKFPSLVFNLAGKLTIGESAAIIQKAQFVITPDTGMMHIAAAFKKPIHVVWGNTIKKFGMFPYFGSEIVKIKHHEVPGLKCRPCSKLGFNTCPEKHFNCMRQQQFDRQTLEL